MIIAKLIGGLGNQMFQYALGRKLAITQNCALKLDRTGFINYKVHNYELDRFNIVGKETSLSSGIVRMALRKINPSIEKMFIGNALLVQEKSLRFDPSIFGYRAPLIIDGYWQSEKYFKDIRESLLRDLTLKHDPSLKNAAWMKEIESTNSVSIHIRRGDYISNPSANQVHGVMPLSYYENAISKLKEFGKDMSYFVFSDDPEWVQQNLKVDAPMYFVTNNIGAGFEDLRLMKRCKHNIIANSSFSWWAAWLNENPNKKVLAPARWFNDPQKDASDILPEEWIKIPLA